MRVSKRIQIGPGGLAATRFLTQGRRAASAIERNPRLRLVLLVVVALSSTTMRPFAWSGEMEAGPAAHELGATAARSVEGTPVAAAHSVDRASFTPQVESVATTVTASLQEAGRDSLTYARVNDAMIAAQIDRRLERRHTGLSVRERTELAHAIVREARAFDLEPELVIAVIEVESAGYPLAVSHVGALGLMQILPVDGRGAGGQARRRLAGRRHALRPASST